MPPPNNRQPKRREGANPIGNAPPRRGQPLSARAALDNRLNRTTGSQSQKPMSARRPSLNGHGDTNSCQVRAQQYYSQLLGSSPKMRQDWALVHEIDALDHLADEEVKRRAVREKNVRNQTEICAQLQARHNVADNCRATWQQWRTELEEDVSQYQKEEEMKRAFNLETQKRFNQERQQQLEEDRRRKDLLKEGERKLEREMMLLADQAKQRQEVSDAAKKSKQKEAMMQMRSQAVAAEERKQAAKKEEHVRDIKMQQDYEELLEKQDANRGKYFQSIKDKQQAMLDKYESGVGNELARLQAKDDERARQYAAQKLEKEKMDHEARERCRKNLAESGRLAVSQQLSLQAQDRQKQRDDEQRFMEKVQREAALADAKETEKDRKKREAVQANALFIRKQIQEKEAKSPPKTVQRAQMSEIERQLNREKLERACDPTRVDGLQSLLRKKSAEFQRLQRGQEPLTMPG